MSILALTEIETPAVIIDEVIVDKNIARAQSICNKHGLAFRPHIKTHKLPLIANKQLAAGAIGINAQKISEAEVFADAGCDDILITYNILGDAKIKRLVTLNNRVKHLTVVADSAVTIDGLATAFTHKKPLNVLVECDTGGGRVGVQDPEEAVALAKSIHQHDGLKFNGLMTFPAKDATDAVEAFMATARARLMAEGLECPIISIGGTPGLYAESFAPSATEHRAGTYVFNDKSHVKSGSVGWDDCAAHVLATVVSTPTENRAVIDAGSKVLSSDLFGLEHFGHVIERDDLTIVALTEEHGIIHGAHGFEVGQQIKIIPNHICVVINLMNDVYLKRNNNYERIRVAARGLVE